MKTHEGKTVPSRVRGKLKLEDMKVTNPVAVGDVVFLSFEDNGNGIILSVQERENYLIRRSTRKTAYGQIMASNIDLAVLVATLSFPRTSLGFIDRFLVAAESFRIPALLVFNKSDMWGDAEVELLKEFELVYRDIGTDFITVSAKGGDNLRELKEKLSNKKSLFAGHSGVGKSSIINKLSDQVNQKTAEVSTFANKGTHTTTFAEMFEIVSGTYVIDTPGIKELGLMDIFDEEISHFFPEMRALFGECKFYNCTHIHEPNCAVIQAVESGQISISRYESYLSMMEGIDSFR